MTQAVEIRPATLKDVDAVLELERLTQNAPHWPRTAYVGILEGQRPDLPGRCLFIAEGLVAQTGSGVAGFVVAKVPPRDLLARADRGEPEGLVGELESVVVSEMRRRGGVGRALCVAALAWCGLHGVSAVELEVRAGNSAALALYGSLGFSETGRRPRYYRAPDEDAVLLHLLLGH